MEGRAGNLHLEASVEADSDGHGTRSKDNSAKVCVTDEGDGLGQLAGDGPGGGHAYVSVGHEAAVHARLRRGNIVPVLANWI